MMKNLFKSSAIALMIAASGMSVAHAEPVNINVTGNVVASPCVVNNSKTSYDVDLGQTIQAADLATAGAATTPVAFDLTMASCPSGTKKVIVTFTGTADTDQPTMYKNTGTATPLAVELSSAGTVISNNGTLTKDVAADKTVTYNLSARAVTATGSVMPGTIVSVIQANFTYN